MSLYDRITTDISTHALTAALRRWAAGSTIASRASIIAAFSLVGDDITDLDAIAAAYTAEPNASAKRAYLMAISDAFMLAEEGFYTEANVKTELGF